MSSLEDVVAAAESVADDQRRVAARARAMVRERKRGTPWSDILDREPSPGVLHLLRESARRSTATAGRLASVLASGLTEEGESRRQIARRLGVTHQRVSAIIHSDRRRAPRGPSADR